MGKVFLSQSMVRRFVFNLVLILFICSGLAVQVKVSYGEGDYAEEVVVDHQKLGGFRPMVLLEGRS